MFWSGKDCRGRPSLSFLPLVTQSVTGFDSTHVNSEQGKQQAVSGRAFLIMT